MKNRFFLMVFIPLSMPFSICSVHAADPLLAMNIPVNMELSRTDPLIPQSLTFQSVPNKNYESLTAFEETLLSYEQSVTTLEQTYGAYHDDISEELLSMGHIMRRHGKYDQAVDAFERALYINRINQGLHNLNQLPVLELLIETNTARSDWSSLEDNYNYLYWVCKRNYGDKSLDMLPVIDRMARFHLNAYHHTANSELPYFHLLNAIKYYNNAISIVEYNNGDSDPVMIGPLYGVTLTSYEMAAHVVNANNMTEVHESMQRFANIESIMMRADSRESIAYGSYLKGKKAMQRIVDIYSVNDHLPDDSRAIAYAHQGDWFLLFNRKRSAMQAYQQSYDLLTHSGNSDIGVERVFGKPKSLPVIKMPLAYKETKKDRYVLASLNINAKGRAEEINIIESSDAGDKRFMRKANKIIKATAFRPRFENGQAVVSSDVQIRYIFE